MQALFLVCLIFTVNILLVLLLLIFTDFIIKYLPFTVCFWHLPESINNHNNYNYNNNYYNYNYYYYWC